MSVKLIGRHEKDSRPFRNALAETLDQMMAEDPSIVYIDCDLVSCVNTKRLFEHYPDRAIQAGIAEANAAGIAAGLAATGKKPFFHSFSVFSTRRCYDQIYMSAAYAGLTVHVLGSDPGVTAALNGGTHMPMEDGAIYLSVPGATVVDVADFDQFASVLRQLPGITKGITFTRFPRKGSIRVYDSGSEFPIGKAVTLRESGADSAAVFASGILVDEALRAQEALAAEGISVRVIDLFTWKPLDEETVVRAAQETGAVVTAENHNVVNGMGSMVANCLVRHSPVPQEFVGVQDRFGQVGPQDFLMDEYGLRAADIIAAVKRVLSRKA